MDRLNSNQNTLPVADGSDVTKIGVSDYITAATSANTRTAYQSDIRHFLKEGGTLPATPEIIQYYLIQCAEQHHHNPRTLLRRVSALRQWHKLCEHPDPIDNPLVKKTLRGIARIHGRPKKQAVALRLKDLDVLSEHLLSLDALSAVRNRALLLVGFLGAFRASELVSLSWEQIHFVSEGIVITLYRSKTDQTGEGMKCMIPFGNDLRCPVRALIEWRRLSGCATGKVFRRISKTGTVAGEGISSCYWNTLIQRLAKEAKLPYAEDVSSHSLRRGFATESSRLGANMPEILRQGRWRSVKTVMEYIEAGYEFETNAVNVLFDWKS